MADNLREILDIARLEMPDVPEEVWERFAVITRLNLGTQRLYIAALRKRAHLETLAKISDEQTAAQIANLLGVTPHRVRQLKRLAK